jgi:hypothetical protein
MTRGNEISTITYFQALVESLDRRIDRRLIDQERAVDVALESINSRLAYLNELRGAMQDQANTYLPRKEYHIMHDNLTSKLDGLLKHSLRDEASAKGHKEGVAGIGSSISAVFIGLMTLVSVISMIISLLHKW